MKKAADFLVNKRLWFFFASVAAVIVSLVLMRFVTVNEDLTEYLPEDSSMRRGLEIMEEEFPAEERTQRFRLMFEDLNADDRDAVILRLEGFEGVTSAQFSGERTDRDGETFSLFLADTAYTDPAETTRLMNSGTKALREDYTLYSHYENQTDDILDLLLPLALSLFLLVLILLCQSYMEAALLLAAIVCSIAINTGTNCIFPSVSDMTLSIAAVLQLVLSIDYSVMMFHRYAQERAALGGKDNVQAMKNAVKNVFSSVSGSALTTIVGLLVLLLMSFTIGTDMGLVMAKGILCSLICVFTVMPALILWCDGLLIKTNKQYLRERRKLKKEAKKNA